MRASRFDLTFFLLEQIIQVHDTHTKSPVTMHTKQLLTAAHRTRQPEVTYFDPVPWSVFRLLMLNYKRDFDVGRCGQLE